MVRVEGVLVTTQAVEAYGGVSLSRQLVESVPDMVKSGRIPLGVRHDPRLRFNATVIDAYTREREDGELEAVAIWEIDDGEWEKHNADQMRGFSISVTSTIVGESEAAIELVADAHWYSKDDLLTAFAELNTSNQSASVGHLYQFAYEPDTLIVLQWVVPQLTSVAVGLITNFVYDSLKRLLRKAPPLSKVSMEFTDENDGTTSKFYIETGSVEVLKHAIDSIPAAIAANKRQMQYRDEDENWVSLDE